MNYNPQDDVAKYAFRITTRGFMGETEGMAEI